MPENDVETQKSQEQQPEVVQNTAPEQSLPVLDPQAAVGNAELDKARKDAQATSAAQAETQPEPEATSTSDDCQSEQEHEQKGHEEEGESQSRPNGTTVQNPAPQGSQAENRPRSTSDDQAPQEGETAPAENSPATGPSSDAKSADPGAKSSEEGGGAGAEADTSGPEHADEKTTSWLDDIKRFVADPAAGVGAVVDKVKDILGSMNPGDATNLFDHKDDQYAVRGKQMHQEALESQGEEGKKAAAATANNPASAYERILGRAWLDHQPKVDPNQPVGAMNTPDERRAVLDKLTQQGGKSGTEGESKCGSTVLVAGAIMADGPKGVSKLIDSVDAYAAKNGTSPDPKEMEAMTRVKEKIAKGEPLTNGDLDAVSTGVHSAMTPKEDQGKITGTKDTAVAQLMKDSPELAKMFKDNDLTYQSIGGHAVLGMGHERGDKDKTGVNTAVFDPSKRMNYDRDLADEARYKQENANDLQKMLSDAKVKQLSKDDDVAKEARKDVRDLEGPKETEDEAKERAARKEAIEKDTSLTPSEKMEKLADVASVDALRASKLAEAVERGAKGEDIGKLQDSMGAVARAQAYARVARDKELAARNGAGQVVTDKDDLKDYREAQVKTVDANGVHTSAPYDPDAPPPQRKTTRR